LKISCFLPRKSFPVGFLFLSLFAVLALADTQSGVVRSGAQSIPGATVIADCGAQRITTVTDDAGRFEIGGLPTTPCRFSVAMFGFEPVQKEATASSTSITLDLQLQKRATLPVLPQGAVAPPTPAKPAEPAVPAVTTAAPPASTPATSATPAPAPVTAARGSGRGGPGRGGPGRGAAAGARGQAGGYQNLSLVQNGDNPVPTGDVEPLLGGSPDDAGGSNDSFVTIGSVSTGVQAQSGDGAGLGGPGAFGPGGPGGLAGNTFNTVVGAADAAVVVVDAGVVADVAARRIATFSSATASTAGEASSSREASSKPSGTR
jgi:hypothetical protein